MVESVAQQPAELLARPVHARLRASLTCTMSSPVAIAASISWSAMGLFPSVLGWGLVTESEAKDTERGQRP